MNNSLARYAPWIAIAAGCIYFLLVAVPPSDPPEEMQITRFGALPVKDHGRVKPFDSLARVSLASASGYETCKDGSGQTQSAVRWLLEVMAAGLPSEKEAEHESESRRAFRVEDEKVRELVGLKPSPDSMYSFEELKPGLDKLYDEAKRVVEDKEKARSDYETAVAELALQVAFYREYARHETAYRCLRIDNFEVLDLLALEKRSGYRYGFDEVVPRIYQLIKEADRVRGIKRRGEDKSLTLYDAKLLETAERVELYLGLARMNAPTLLVVPPSSRDGKWMSFNDVLQEMHQGGENKMAMGFAGILSSYKAGDVKGFNERLASYENQVESVQPDELGMSRFETYFNHCTPFFHCKIVYILVFLLAVVGFLVAPLTLTRTAFWLALIVLTVHSLALIARMSIQGRPPVTNLYSSAVFIGWGCLVTALVMEAIWKNGINLVVAAVCGFLTMQVAEFLGGGEDTMNQMIAVLDTNFWLSTHVTCVTFGYTATFLAGGLGILFVVLGISGALRRQLLTSLSQMIYGVVCFATLLSFVGTVLGGIWADQSWGRFWGWDPKENGALLIVLWNALILHARWSGMVKQRGMAVLAIIGNMVTGWSWFGTNQLGVGLHAYGFSNALATGLAIFWLIQGAFVLAGLVPLKYWPNYGAASVLPPSSEDLTPVPEPRGKKKQRGEPASTGIKGRR